MLKLGDCLEVMSELPENCIDCCITDPPFGYTKNEWDTVIPFEDMWRELKRIVKPSGAILLFADGMYMAELMVSNKKMWRYNLVWDKVMKTGFLNANRMPLRKHEEICVFYQKLPTYNPQFEEGSPNHSKGKEKEVTNNNYGEYKFVEDRNTKEKYPSSIIRKSKVHPSKTIHPTEKPLDLMVYLVKTFSNKGDTVLDFACGSGVTGVACLETERNFIGVEKNEHYFEISKKRIEEHEKAPKQMSFETLF